MNINARKIGLGTAVSLVIANMIGTGVFTSLGYQVLDIHNVFALMMLWAAGGVMALCGALVYGEIGRVFPNSGGEYNYLSKIYHPSAGFLAGWVSATVGFSAPIAMAAMALSSYVDVTLHSAGAGGKFIADETFQRVLAIAVVIVITLIHSFNLKAGSLFQRAVTILKVAVITFIIIAGFSAGDHQPISLSPGADGWSAIFSGSFAVSLYWVTYSYSGWNASAYMAGEIENPKRNLPRSLFVGTLAVTILYVLLNYIFLYTTPMNELAGNKEIGLISANNIFGAAGGKIMGMLISFLLVSAISAMVMAGPRVIQSMGNDVKLLGFFTITNKNGVPYVAVIVQSLIAIVLVLTAKFEFVLEFTSFSLNLFTFLTVLGIFFLSFKKGVEFHSRNIFLFFIPAVIFLAFQVWILYYGFTEKKDASMLGMINLGIGLVFWVIAALVFGKKKNSPSSI